MLPWANRTENSFTRVVVRHGSVSASVGCTTLEECALRKIAMVASLCLRTRITSGQAASWMGNQFVIRVFASVCEND